MSNIQIILSRDIYQDNVVEPVTLTNPLYVGDNLAQRVRFRVFRRHGDIAPVDMSSLAIRAYFARPDGGTVMMDGVSGKEWSYVDLPAACYAYPGTFDLVIKSVADTAETTIMRVVGELDKPVTGTIVDPGTDVGNIEEIVEAFLEIDSARNTCVEAAGTSTAAAETATAAADAASADAQTASEAAASAQESAQAAGDSAANASESETSASGSAAAAAASETNAAGSATEAAGSAADAAASKAAAQAAQTAAQAAQTAAETAASEEVADWLAAHVDPETGYVLDNTLAIQGAAADAKAAGDAIGDIKSAIEHSSVFGLSYEALAANDYQTGRYNATSGSRQGQDSTAYICTKDYLPSDVASVSVADGYKVGVHVWDTSKDPVEHIGMITSTGIRLNSGTDGQLTEPTDLTRYPDTYKFKLDLFAPSEGEVYCNTDYDKISLGYKTDKTLTVNGVPADAKTVGDILGAEYTDITDSVWTQGGITASNGSEGSQGTRIRLTVPRGAVSAKVTSNANLVLWAFCWDDKANEPYKGGWTGSGFTKSSSSLGAYTELDFEPIYAAGANRIVLVALNGTSSTASVSPSDGANIVISKRSSIFDEIEAELNGKISKPAVAGTEGQYLKLGSDGEPEWATFGEEYIDIPTTASDWTQGGITVSNGNESSVGTRIRMTAPDGVISAKVINNADVKFWVFCWQGTTYQGAWTGSGFTKASSSLVAYTELDFTPIYATGTTKIVIVGIDGTDNTQSILPSAGVNIEYVKYESIIDNNEKIDKLDANLNATHDYDFWVEKQVINTNQTAGETVDITPTTNGAFNHQLIPVKKGDKLVITDEGGRDARAWAFTDTDYKLLSASNANTVCSAVEQTAAEDGYLIVNHKRASTTTPSIVKIGYLNADETITDVNALKKSAVSLDARVGTLERIPKARFEIDHTLKDVSSIVSKIKYSQSEINPDTGRVWRADLMFQIYDLFDELAEDYPDLVTKYDAASEAWLGSGNAIAYPAYANGVSSGDPDYLETPAYRTYIYKISNITTGAGNNQSNKKRAFFVGGTHGGEVGSPFNLYIFAKLLCGIADENYFKLLSTFDFYILPCLDGYTMIHYDDPASGALRMNANLVNINRNFPIANWTEAGEGTYDYTGPSPASEFETQIVIAATNKIHPDLAIDHHTYHDEPRQFYSEICNSKFMPLAYQALVDCSAAFIKCLPQYFGTKYQLFVEDSYAFAPKVPLSHASGRTSVWWDEAGVPFAATVEINGSISFLNGEYHMRQDPYGNDMFSVGEYTFRTQVLLYAQWVLDNA